MHHLLFSLFPPFSYPNFRLSSFSNARTHSQTKAKTETRNGNKSLPAPDPPLPQHKFLQVVLVSPQIPGNAGCIARTCAASAVALHLVGPLGFKVDDTKLKRAGLDYRPYVVVRVHSSWAEFQNYFKQQDFTYRKGDYLIIGSETCGLPPDVLLDCRSETFGGGNIRIPMVETYVRCLNVSGVLVLLCMKLRDKLNYEQLQGPSGNCGDSEQSFLSEDIFA